MCNAVKNTEDVLRHYFVLTCKGKQRPAATRKQKILVHLVGILTKELKIWHKDSWTEQNSNMSNLLEKKKLRKKAFRVLSTFVMKFSFIKS